MTNGQSTLNVGRVLRTIWLRQQISRVDVAAELGVNKSTVTKIVGSLLDVGLVRVAAEGIASPQGGRKPQFLSINDDFGCIVGVEIQTESWTAVAIDLSGRIVRVETEELSFRSSTAISVFVYIVERMRARLAEAGLSVLGACVGVSGIVNVRSGVLEQSRPLGVFEPLNFCAEVRKYLDLPILVENDANCCCWGELTFDVTDRARNFIYILGEYRRPVAQEPSGHGQGQGLAVGTGLVLNGHVHHGESNSAGEFRSLLWEDGNTGQFSVSDEEMFSVPGNPDITRRVIEELSAHIAFLVNTLNMTRVVVGGDLEQHSALIQESLAREIQRNWSYGNDVECEIRVSQLGRRSVAYGAAAMFLEHLFAPPERPYNEQRGPDGIELLSSILENQPDLSSTQLFER